MDGSRHAWLDDRGPPLTLQFAVDDATSRVVAAVFREQEDAAGYLLVLRQVSQTLGLPLAVYTDRHSIFHQTRPRPLTLPEQLQGCPEPTQVGRALHELGIRWIPAASPQTKGRVERTGGTFQDRRVVELRLAGITTCEDANAFLPTFLARFNARFAHAPAQPDAAYRPWPAGLAPDTVFRFKYRAPSPTTTPCGWGPISSSSPPARRSYAKAPR